MLAFQHKIHVAASAASVFSRYRDVGTWPSWDPETLAVDLPGLTVGATGWLKPRQGPRARIAIAEVTEDRSFTVEGRLPLCRMVFGHELYETGTGTLVTHSVGFSGPLAFLFRRLVGRGIDRTLPRTLAGLKAATENASVQT